MKQLSHIGIFSVAILLCSQLVLADYPEMQYGTIVIQETSDSFMDFQAMTSHLGNDDTGMQTQNGPIIPVVEFRPLLSLDGLIAEIAIHIGFAVAGIVGLIIGIWSIWFVAEGVKEAARERRQGPDAD